MKFDFGIGEAVMNLNDRQVPVVISEQSFRMLERLAEYGIYGSDVAEIAARFIDQALEQFIETPKLDMSRFRPVYWHLNKPI